jgi:hypothetical protein
MTRSPHLLWSLVCALAPLALPAASAQRVPVQVVPAQPAQPVQPVQIAPVGVAPVQAPRVLGGPVRMGAVAAPVMPLPVKNGKDTSDGLTLLIEHYLDHVDAPDGARRFPCKIHAVKLDKETPYQIDMVGHGIDAYLRLLDEHGKVLAEDDDSGGNLNARIRHTTTKGGIYFIVATTCAGGEGAYTLSVRKLQPAAPRKIVAMNPVNVKKPSEVKAQLNANDQPDQARSVPCQIHSIALKANKTYVIDLESTDFDAYLRLESPDAKMIQEDDDSGGNLNSRIEYRVSADGNYRLVAMPLHNLNGNVGGQYTLRVTEKE